jgi:hypothetical protein
MIEKVEEDGWRCRGESEVVRGVVTVEQQAVGLAPPSVTVPSSVHVKPDPAQVGKGGGVPFRLICRGFLRDIQCQMFTLSDITKSRSMDSQISPSRSQQQAGRQAGRQASLAE